MQNGLARAGAVFAVILVHCAPVPELAPWPAWARGKAPRVVSVDSRFRGNDESPSVAGCTSFPRQLVPRESGERDSTSPVNERFVTTSTAPGLTPAQP